MDNEKKQEQRKSTFTRPFRMIARQQVINRKFTTHTGGCKTGRCGLPKQEIQPEEKKEENK